MSDRPKHREFPLWAQAMLIFGAGFGVARWLISERDPQATAVRRDLPSRVAEAHGPARFTNRLVQLDPRIRDLIPRTEPVPEATAIRRSRLPEWMRFRYEHSHLALSTEMAVRLALDAPISLRDATNACSAKLRIEPVRDLDISAEIVLQGRDATVRGWGCEASDTAVAGRICDCVLEQLAPEYHVVVPGEVADEDLAPYDGMLSLRVWL
jgi:hypothetical protein